MDQNQIFRKERLHFVENGLGTLEPGIEGMSTVPFRGVFLIWRGFLATVTRAFTRNRLVNWVPSTNVIIFKGRVYMISRILPPPYSFEERGTLRQMFSYGDCIWKFHVHYFFLTNPKKGFLL